MKVLIMIIMRMVITTKLGHMSISLPNGNDKMMQYLHRKLCIFLTFMYSFPITEKKSLRFFFKD